MDHHDQMMRNYLRGVFDSLHSKAMEYYMAADNHEQRAQRVGEIITAYRGITTKFGIAGTVDGDGICIECAGKCIGSLCLGTDIGATSEDLSNAGVKFPQKSKPQS